MSLLILFSKRWVDLGGAAVYAGRYLAKEYPKEVEKLSKRAAKGKRKKAKELKQSLILDAIEATKAENYKLEAPAVSFEDLDRAIKAFELMQANIKHLYNEKAAKEYNLELQRLKAEQKRLFMLEELENELLTFLLTI